MSYSHVADKDKTGVQHSQQNNGQSSARPESTTVTTPTHNYANDKPTDHMLRGMTDAQLIRAYNTVRTNQTWIKSGAVTVLEKELAWRNNLRNNPENRNYTLSELGLHEDQMKHLNREQLDRRARKLAGLGFGSDTMLIVHNHLLARNADQGGQSGQGTQTSNGSSASVAVTVDKEQDDYESKKETSMSMEPYTDIDPSKLVSSETTQDGAGTQAAQAEPEKNYVRQFIDREWNTLTQEEQSAHILQTVYDDTKHVTWTNDPDKRWHAHPDTNALFMSNNIIGEHKTLWSFIEEKHGHRPEIFQQLMFKLEYDKGIEIVNKNRHESIYGPSRSRGQNLPGISLEEQTKSYNMAYMISDFTLQDDTATAAEKKKAQKFIDTHRRYQNYYEETGKDLRFFNVIDATARRLRKQGKSEFAIKVAQWERQKGQQAKNRYVDIAKGNSAQITSSLIPVHMFGSAMQAQMFDNPANTGNVIHQATLTQSNIENEANKEEIIEILGGIPIGAKPPDEILALKPVAVAAPADDEPISITNPVSAPGEPVIPLLPAVAEKEKGLSVLAGGAGNSAAGVTFYVDGKAVSRSEYLEAQLEYNNNLTRYNEWAKENNQLPAGVQGPQLPLSSESETVQLTDFQKEIHGLGPEKSPIGEFLTQGYEDSIGGWQINEGSSIWEKMAHGAAAGGINLVHDLTLFGRGVYSYAVTGGNEDAANKSIYDYYSQYHPGGGIDYGAQTLFSIADPAHKEIRDAKYSGSGKENIPWMAAATSAEIGVMLIPVVGPAKLAITAASKVPTIIKTTMSLDNFAVKAFTGIDQGIIKVNGQTINTPSRVTGSKPEPKFIGSFDAIHHGNQGIKTNQVFTPNKSNNSIITNPSKLIDNMTGNNSKPPGTDKGANASNKPPGSGPGVGGVGAAGFKENFGNNGQVTLFKIGDAPGVITKSDAPTVPTLGNVKPFNPDVSLFPKFEVGGTGMVQIQTPKTRPGMNQQTDTVINPSKELPGTQGPKLELDVSPILKPPGTDTGTKLELDVSPILKPPGTDTGTKLELDVEPRKPGAPNTGKQTDLDLSISKPGEPGGKTDLDTTIKLITEPGQTFRITEITGQQEIAKQAPKLDSGYKFDEPQQQKLDTKLEEPEPRPRKPTTKTDVTFRFKPIPPNLVTEKKRPPGGIFWWKEDPNAIRTRRKRGNLQKNKKTYFGNTKLDKFGGFIAGRAEINYGVMPKEKPIKRINFRSKPFSKKF